MKKKILNFVFPILLGLLIAVPGVFARQSAVWVEGTVTRSPWVVDSQNKIEVNGVAYDILPNIRITYRYLRNQGAYDERTITLNTIAEGREIQVKVRKKNVIQIILF